MPTTDLVRLAARLESLEGVLADRHEHAEARVALDVRLAQQALIDELAQAREDVRADLVSRTTNGLDLFDRGAADEHGAPGEKPLQRVVQEVIAPRDRAAERALPVGSIRRRAREQVEPLLQARQHRLRRQQLHARGCELDRER